MAGPLMLDQCPCRPVLRLCNVPDASIKQGLVLAVLGDDGQQVILEDLARPQLLTGVPRVILMLQVPDQVLHTLYRGHAHRVRGYPCSVHKSPIQDLHYLFRAVRPSSD